MSKAKAFYSEMIGDAIAAGVGWSDEPMGDTIEIDYNYDRDGKAYVAFDGVYGLGVEITPEQIRKFAKNLNKLADEMDRREKEND